MATVDTLANLVVQLLTEVVSETLTVLCTEYSVGLYSTVHTGSTNL